MCHMNFIDVLNSDFKAFGSKMSCLRDQNKAFKDTFFFFGGGAESAKKVLFEWPKAEFTFSRSFLLPMDTTTPLTAFARFVASCQF